jgi:hypothetical protein
MKTMNNLISKVKGSNWKDIIIRAVKTFVEAFLSYVTIDGIFEITDTTGAKRFLLTTGVSALAAGISAVWNLGMEIVSQKVSEELDELNGTVEDVEEATFTESEVE